MHSDGTKLRKKNMGGTSVSLDHSSYLASRQILYHLDDRCQTMFADPNTSPQRKRVNPRVALFKQVGTRAFGTAFTRWRVGLVLSMIDSRGGRGIASRKSPRSFARR
jgi:hypothetical protein